MNDKKTNIRARICGRVVCGHCSQHRIWVPSSAVVKPPPVCYASLNNDPRSGPRCNSVTRNSVEEDGSDEPVEIRVCGDCLREPSTPILDITGPRERNTTEGAAFPYIQNRGGQIQDRRGMQIRTGVWKFLIYHLEEANSNRI